MLARKKIAVIGAGKLGETIIRALLDAKIVQPDQLRATTRHKETASRKSEVLGIPVGNDNPKAVKGADIVILAVKPQGMELALASLRKAVEKDQLVISIAASVSTGAIERGLPPGVPVVRTMPNTPCLVRAGMTGVCPGKHAKREHLALTEYIFSSLGRVIVLDEKHMDAVTGLSASGPAFMYVSLESMAEGGVAAGLPREIATELAAQTMLGAAQMVLETREHPAKLKDIVTTPAGCTIDGLLELEAGGLRVTLIKTVVRAAKRASELVDG